MTLELVVEKGTHRASSGYHGRCRLRLRNSQKETLAALELSEVFAGSATQDFRDDISLETVDYNEDGRMEVAVGQRSARKASDEAVSVTNSAVARQLKKQNTYEYYVIDIGEDKLTLVSPGNIRVRCDAAAGGKHGLFLCAGCGWRDHGIGPERTPPIMYGTTRRAGTS